MIGQRFGRLTVTGLSDRYEKGRGKYYICRCDCGNEKVIRGDILKSGDSRSCGCLHDELLREKAKKAYKNNFKDGTNIPRLKSDKSQTNSSTGIPGVSWHKRQRKWQARIQFKGKSYFLGYFESIEEAKAAREKAKQELHCKYIQAEGPL